MRVSYSALSSFNQCPLKYKWQYIDRIKVPTTPDLFFGSLVHDVLEFALKNGVIQPLEKSLEYYKNNWRKDVFLSHPEQSDGSRDSSRAQNDNENKEKQFYDSGLEMIKNFYASYKPTEIQVLSTEKFFEIYWGEHKIVGKIDRIDKLPTGEIEIIDYKTNKKLPRDDDFKYDYQLPLYAWAAQTLYPCHSERSEESRDPSSQITLQDDKNVCPPIKLTFYYLRHNKQIDPPNTKTLEELQSYILDTIYKIQASSFEPQTSTLCGWCEYLNMCPEGQEYLNQKSKINPSRLKGEAEAENQNENIKVKNQSLELKSDSQNSNKKIRISSNKISQNQQSLF